MPSNKYGRVTGRLKSVGRMRDYTTDQDWLRALYEKNRTYLDERIDFARRPENKKASAFATQEFASKTNFEVFEQEFFQEKFSLKSTGEYRGYSQTLHHLLRKEEFMEKGERDARHAFNIIKDSPAFDVLNSKGLSKRQDIGFNQLTYRSNEGGKEIYRFTAKDGKVWEIILIPPKNSHDPYTVIAKEI